MGYIVPSSKIVFTDFMILLVSTMMGLNSVMTFSTETKERNLPPVILPEIQKINKTGADASDTDLAVLTIKQDKIGEKIYFYNKKKVTLCQLKTNIKNASVTRLVLRGDKKSVFQWQEFCHLSSELSKAGVKVINYSTTSKGEIGK